MLLASNTGVYHAPNLSTHPPPDGVPDLGPLHNEYATLLLAADDAKRAHHRAVVGGNRSEIREASFQLDKCRGDLHAFKERTAADMVLMLRCMEEIYPGKLAELVDPHVRTELDATQDAIVAAEQRLDDVENAVVTLEDGRGSV